MMRSDRLFMEHHIARQLGGMTVTEMRQRMTVDEYREHVAYLKRLHAESQARGNR